ncbi:hypothetical protein [Microbulbifer halophilus]|uniref:Ribosomal protein L7/L12 C-terminal domain-containing protein n=1 Tax=Microbulbifer halophilus TaxID=453963 RepID=A0ABW5EDK9_9GAMM|nr:hypothetical protein [Microbulbifer halophilus]MCW8126959.1 hypothetical protein [Microbulbifer halophilus]
MSQPTYSVIFRGDLVPGFTAADVKANLARLFKAGPETVEKLFSGRPLAIKKGLPEARAEQLQATLAKLGAQAALKAEGEAAAPPSPAAAEPEPAAAEAPAAQPASPSGGDWGLAPMEGNLVREHEREKKDAVQVSVDHLSLRPAQGNLVEDGEHRRKQPVAVDIPDWQIN